MITPQYLTNTSPKVFRPIYLLPVLIFLCLALYKTATTSLWLDEIMALDFCDGSIKEMMGELQRDVHAPLFYLILFCFIKVFGIAELTGRLPAILSGAGTVAALYFLAREVRNIRTGILASLILAISPFFIEFSREIHPYSLTALFAVLSWFWFIRVIKRGKSQDAILYSLASAFMILTFYLGIIIVLSQLLLLIFLRLSRRKRRAIFYALIGATCLSSVWLPTFIRQLMANKISHAIEVYFPKGIQPTHIIYLLSDVFLGTSARQLHMAIPGAFIALISVSTFFILIRKTPVSGMTKLTFSLSSLMPLWLFWSPFLLFTLLCLFKPLYLSRYFTMGAPFAALLIAAALEKTGGKKSLFILAPLIILWFISYGAYIKSIPREDWRGTANYLATRMGTQDVVVADTITAASCLDYYLALLGRQDLTRNVFTFEQFYKTTQGRFPFPERRLWYLWRNIAYTADTKWINTRQLELILQENTFLERRKFLKGFALISFKGGKTNMQTNKTDLH